MSDLIDRQAAIDALNRLCDRVCQYSKAQRKVMCGACPLGDAFTVIEDDLPTIDTEPAGCPFFIGNTHDRGDDSLCGLFHREVKYLAIETRQVGEWIDDNCSLCGQYVHHGDARNYCPNCGAIMVEGEGDET